MAKRRSKQQKEADEKAALRRRVLDMAFGSFGDYRGAADIDSNSDEHKGMFYSMSPDSLGRWIGAVKVHLIVDNKPAAYLLEPRMLEHWDSLNDIVERLYGCGVRA